MSDLVQDVVSLVCMSAFLVSMAIWIGAIFAGRMIGFTTTRQATPPPPASEEINFEDLLGLPPAK